MMRFVVVTVEASVAVAVTVGIIVNIVARPTRYEHDGKLAIGAPVPHLDVVIDHLCGAGSDLHRDTRSSDVGGAGGHDAGVKTK